MYSHVFSAIFIRLDDSSPCNPVKPMSHLNLIYSVELVFEGLFLQIIMRYAQNHGNVLAWFCLCSVLDNPYRVIHGFVVASNTNM